MITVTPFLWYDGQAQAAAEFYTSLFEDGQVLEVNQAGPDQPAMSVTISLQGQKLILFNGGPNFKFNESVSMFIECDTQDQVDDLWQKLTSDGQAGQCGWLKDKFGLSWQVVPAGLGEVLGDPDTVKAQKALQAMLQMQKLDLEALKQARDSQDESKSNV